MKIIIILFCVLGFSIDCFAQNLNSNIIVAKSVNNNGSKLSKSSSTQNTGIYKTGEFNNDASVELVYSYGKVPINNSSPVKIAVIVKNNGINTLTGISVSLKISGVNYFSNSIVVSSLSPNQTTLISFDEYKPVYRGEDTVTVSIPSDDDDSNNSKTSLMHVTQGSYAYCQNIEADAGVGFSNTGGLFLNRYFVQNTANIYSVTFVPLYNEVNIGKIVYGVVLESNGNILAKTGYYVIKESDLNRPVSLTFPAKPAVTNKNIFIGIAQTSGGYYPVSCLEEKPGRNDAYYSANLDGSFLSQETEYGCLMIEANLNTIPEPLSLETFDVWARGFTVAWDSTCGANKYYLDIATDSLFTNFVDGYNNRDVGNETDEYGYPNYWYKKIYIINGLLPGTKYYLRIKSSDGISTSLPSVVVSETTHKENTLIPQNLVAGNGFKNCIPLTWYTPDYILQNREISDSGKFHYTIYRKVEGGEYQIIYSPKDGEVIADYTFYMDTLVTEGIKYYYRAGCVINGVENSLSNEVSASCSGINTSFNIPISHVTPLIDGKVNDEEWGDALNLNLTNNLGVLTTSLGLILDDQGSLVNPIPSKNVFGYFKRAGDNFYIGIKDFNDVTNDTSDAKDFISLFFDASEENVFDNGDGWLISLGGLFNAYFPIYGKYPVYIETSSDSMEINPTGFLTSSAMVDSHREWEIKIDLKNSNLKMNNENSLGLSINVQDRETNLLDAQWPNGSLMAAPQTFARLLLNSSTSVNENTGLPQIFVLKQNYPNPFNPNTIIEYSIPKTCQVTLTIFDLLGREVTKLVNEVKNPGSYEASFDGRNLSSGVYFYQLRAGNYTAAKKFTLMK